MNLKELRCARWCLLIIKEIAREQKEAAVGTTSSPWIYSISINKVKALCDENSGTSVERAGCVD